MTGAVYAYGAQFPRPENLWCKIYKRNIDRKYKKSRVKKLGQLSHRKGIMGRPKKDPNAEPTVKETYEAISTRVKKSGALSPTLSAALDEVTTQLSALEAETKKVKKQFKALTKL
jgi:hypothetical protein